MTGDTPKNTGNRGIHAENVGAGGVQSPAFVFLLGLRGHKLLNF
jgi:hypothetical protein